jgi:hypothetical protein
MSKFSEQSVSPEDFTSRDIDRYFRYRQLFTSQDLEKMFQVSSQTIRSWQRNKKYQFPKPLIHDKGGKNLWSRKQLDRFIQKMEDRCNED